MKYIFRIDREHDTGELGDILRGPWVDYEQLDISIGDIRHVDPESAYQDELSMEDIMKMVYSGNYDPNAEIRGMMRDHVYMLVLNEKDFALPILQNADIDFIYTRDK